MCVMTYSQGNELDSLHNVIQTDTSSIEQARAHIILAELYSDTAPNISLQHGMKAFSICSDRQDDDLLYDALQAMNLAFYMLGDYESLLKYSLRSLKLAETRGDPEMICNNHSWISSANMELGYVETAIEHSTKALQIAKASRDSILIAYSTMDMESGYRVLGEYEKGMQYCHQALELFVAMGNKNGESFALQQIGRSYIDQDKFSDALPFSTRALNLIEEDDEDAGSMSIMWSMQDMAEIHSGLGDLDKAEVYISRAEKIATDLGAKHDLAGVLESRSELAEKQGDLVAALKYYKEFHALNDTLFDKNIAHQMASLQTLYESDQREHENELLRNQNGLQNATISNQMLNNTLLVFAGFIFFVLSFSFFFQFRSKKHVNEKLRKQNALIQEQHDEIGKKNLELQRQNVRLSETMVSEDEKKLLLKEIHHRVKNNLEIINGLLKMQSIHVEDKRSLEMFEECQGRVMSMALVHEQLYNSVDLSNVRIDEYIEKLAKQCIASYGVDLDVHLNLNCTVIGFPIDTLIPLGLLLNELLTNSLKHAFSDRHFGTIKIELDEVGDDVFKLAFSDNGIGMKENMFTQGKTFGVDLIHTLVGQLDGEIRIDAYKGTKFEIIFRQNESQLRAAS